MKTYFKSGRGYCGFDTDRRAAHEEQRHERHRGRFGHFGGGPHGPGGGREGGFGFGGPEGRGGMRMFGSGDLRFVILEMLAERPSHGYELIKAIGERLGGSYTPSPGVIYPMLTMLEELGHATVTSEGARKLYTITEEGRQSLKENQGTVDAIRARMERARDEQASSPMQQIERAVVNFRMALRMKQGPLTTEQIHAITDIIDAAAKQIERL